MTTGFRRLFDNLALYERLYPGIRRSQCDVAAGRYITLSTPDEVRRYVDHVASQRG